MRTKAFSFRLQNPYYEEVPTKSHLTGRMTVKKRPREAPDGVSDSDRKLYAKIRKWAKIMDGQFRPCGLKIGLSSIVGLIPGYVPSHGLFYFGFLFFLSTVQGKGYGLITSFLIQSRCFD